ncbi:MAG TPA: bifunctional demethylmenaquinone methyltransferase/2-methoxy-6-polyprenyl-1,4-benzoquinol methylase UbiE [Candidatus Acidoferrales bacterium]|nr:bifunctional demethylmenaquinone methyltransferase/2-methoxy-6-polyprenyl-1,4-benzoquinol methylase UbiE [Candidatus Acidoferrales bacterium]
MLRSILLNDEGTQINERTQRVRDVGSAAQSNALPGSSPEGARDEREAAARVQRMFAQITPRYDLLNHLLSFNLDRVWRRRAANRVAHILQNSEARVLDLCCGTGDLAFALARKRAGNGAIISGADFVEPMLTRAREKARSFGERVTFSAADALQLPFPDSTFDLVTSAFGFRNLANYESGMREIARVLKPSGEVGILEFSEPGSGPLAGLFRFYFRKILPRLGGAISGSGEAYSYLPASVGRFPSPQELASLMKRCGFTAVQFEAWNFGSVLLHRARRE